MNQILRRCEVPITIALLISGAAYLLKMCYLPLVSCTLLGVLWLSAVYLFARARYGLVMPLMLLALVFAGIEVDALGNFFQLYGRRFGPLMYDEFAHLSIQVLTTPLIIWLLREGLARTGYRLPTGLVSFFAVTTIFSLSALYEVIEMWDERYFGGQHIWSAHDAPNDLQWDFLGIVAGSLLAYFALRRTGQQEATANDLTIATP